MAIKYLLECPCGEKISVSASQAGQTVRCTCGKEREVPTLLELKKLETIEETPSKRSFGGEEKPSNWGPVQGVIAAGTLLSLMALGWLIYVMATKPTPDNLIKEDASHKNLLNKKIDDMSLAETMWIWNVLLKKDIGIRLQTEQQYLEALKAYKVRLWIADILLATGICFTALTLIFSKRAAVKRAEALNKQKREKQKKE